MDFTVKKGSEKGVSRRCLERPLGEYDLLGVRPAQRGIFISGGYFAYNPLWWAILCFKMSNRGKYEESEEKRQRN